MGVPVIWDYLKSGFEGRIPFIVLVTSFYKDFGRPIRIAIDAYQWIFECRVNNVNRQGPELTARLIQNMTSRIRYLISLNVSFVLVFDGDYKPNFKRNADAQKAKLSDLENKNFDDDYKQIRRELREYGYMSSDQPDVRALKSELKRWNISFVEAPSEGEAEAAKLQRVGVVDYVLSNDTDTLAYGATMVLRNFSKFEEDKPPGASGVNQSNEYWCTLVHMNAVTRKTGFDQKRIMLLSILTGADYNAGVTKIGVEKASQIALSSTSKIKQYVATCPYENFEDFAYNLDSIYTGTYDHNVRKQKYSEFQSLLFQRVSENLIEYFGRNEKALVADGKFESFPPDYVVMLYYHPLLCEENFQFEDGTTNFGETSSPSTILSNPKFDLSLEKFKKNKPPNVLHVSLWFTRSLSESYVLKAVIHDLDLPLTLEKRKTKLFGEQEIELISVRFQNFFSNLIDPVELKEEEVTTQKTRRVAPGQLVWIPKDLIPTSSDHYKKFLQKELDDAKIKSSSPQKASPSKPRKPTQGTTLFSMGFIDKVPTVEPVQRSPTKLTRTKSTLKSKNLSPQRTSVVDLLKTLNNEISPKKKLPSSQLILDEEDDPYSDIDLNVSPLKEVTKTISPIKMPISLQQDSYNSPTKFKRDSNDKDTLLESKSSEYVDSQASKIPFSMDRYRRAKTDELLELSPSKKSKSRSAIRMPIGYEQQRPISPVKIKSRKQSIETSPTKGIKTYHLDQLDSLGSKARKKLSFDINEGDGDGDISHITIDDSFDDSLQIVDSGIYRENYLETNSQSNNVDKLDITVETIPDSSMDSIEIVSVQNVNK